jgi:nucleoid-associated protein YgaU
MKRFILLMMIALFVGASVNAQMPPANKPDAELTRKEAEFRLEDFRTRVYNLEMRLDELKKKLDVTKSELDATNKALDDCNKAYKNLVGATDADIEAFRQKLGQIEGRVREMQRLSDAQLLERQDQVVQLENDLNELRANKISLIPEFYNKIIALARDIKGLYREKKTTTYTVGTWAQDRDCLWNIAGKMEIFGDPHMWPKLWHANMDIIRNPDIIFPGQVLQIPAKGPKTDEILKMERKYYREKREAQAGADLTE